MAGVDERAAAEASRRRSGRVLIVATILIALFVLALLFSGLSLGFCEDRTGSERASCERDVRSQAGLFVALLIGSVGLLVAGLMRRSRASNMLRRSPVPPARAPEHPPATMGSGQRSEESSPGTSRAVGVPRHRASDADTTLQIGAATASLVLLGAVFGPAAHVLLGTAVILLAPVAILMGWRSVGRCRTTASARWRATTGAVLALASMVAEVVRFLAG